MENDSFKESLARRKGMKNVVALGYNNPVNFMKQVTPEERKKQFSWIKQNNALLPEFLTRFARAVSILDDSRFETTESGLDQAVASQEILTHIEGLLSDSVESVFRSLAFSRTASSDSM